MALADVIAGLQEEHKYSFKRISLPSISTSLSGLVISHPGYPQGQLVTTEADVMELAEMYIKAGEWLKKLVEKEG